ncbi:nef protein [Simian immunodeficiency virus]|uniref:Protein Nef n=1 Tax=Simian immunodeficiency virus TaxID=11723 RepID=Q6VG33_SIV|nr:nef protein [Simian immunodeficiency virus]
MGSKNSKQQSPLSSTPLLGSQSSGRMRYFMLEDDYGEQSWLSPDASDRERKYSLTEGRNGKQRRQPLDDDDDDDGVGCPVRPRVPLRDPTWKLMMDLSHYLKEKGGLGEMFYCEDRHRKIEQYAYLEWGLIPGWLQYTEGPGVRYPTMPGFLWCLRPVATTEDSEEGDEDFLLTHPAYQGRMEDPHRQFLVFSFCSKLAVKSGRQLAQLQQEERKKRLAANRIL